MAHADDLIDFIADISGEGQLRVEEDLGAGFVRLRIAEAERRQAKHDIQSVEDAVIELLRNSRDAQASQIFLATSREGDVRTITIIDDGLGIPEHMKALIFEPRVTSKLETLSFDKWGIHGRGMALYSIKENALGSEVVTSGVDKGSSILVSFDTNCVHERSDQSTWPVVIKDEDNNLAVESGPHNIARTLVEFSLASKGRCAVYFGTPAEIAATLYMRALEELPASQLLFVDDIDAFSVGHRLACAGDARDLATIATNIGLNISERTAQRIISEEIKPVRDVLSKIRPTKRALSSDEMIDQIDLLKDRRSLRISAQDKEELARQLEEVFHQFANKYYLKLDEPPKIRIGNDKIQVTLPFEKA